MKFEFFNDNYTDEVLVNVDKIITVEFHETYAYLHFPDGEYLKATNPREEILKKLGVN